ncbi:RNA methyltransferase [Candidatus Altiarchaeota archaeon]
MMEPKYDGNVGSIARVMKNFGFSRLILINPCKLGSDARARAMHGRDILEGAEVMDSLEEAAAELDFLVATTAKSAGDSNALRSPVMPWDLAGGLEVKGSIGLVFGREDYGLYNEEIGLCDMQVTIPANPEYPTLNLAQSVGVILYELSKNSMIRKLDHSKFRELDGDRKRVMLEYFHQAADKVYDRDYENGLIKKTFRQITGRAFISGREAQTLIGFFRHVAERLPGKN